MATVWFYGMSPLLFLCIATEKYQISALYCTAYHTPVREWKDESITVHWIAWTQTNTGCGKLLHTRNTNIKKTYPASARAVEKDDTAKFGNGEAFLYIHIHNSRLPASTHTQTHASSSIYLDLYLFGTHFCLFDSEHRGREEHIETWKHETTHTVFLIKFSPVPFYE